MKEAAATQQHREAAMVIGCLRSWRRTEKHVISWSSLTNDHTWAPRFRERRCQVELQLRARGEEWLPRVYLLRSKRHCELVHKPSKKYMWGAGRRSLIDRESRTGNG